MIRGLMLASFILASVAPALGETVQISVNENTTPVANVLLRGLDTLNGTAQDIPVRVGDTIRFGHLEIKVEACRVPSDDPSSDAYAFLKIRDIREEVMRFSGWMFASSPALSALDHQRYDVWVLSCNNS